MSRPSPPSSTQSRSSRSAMRAVISARWRTTSTSSRTTAFWNSSAVSRVSTCSSRCSYVSSVPSAWFVFARTSGTGSSWYRAGPTNSVTVSRCCETEMTMAPVCFATRSAVRCRVPVSSEGIVGSGMSWTFAHASRLRRRVDDDRAVHLRELVEELRPEGRVEADPARVEERELVRVADDDERALVGADDVVDRLAERRARRDLRHRLEQLRVAAGVVFRRRAREPELAQPLGPTLARLPRIGRHRAPLGSLVAASRPA